MNTQEISSSPSTSTQALALRRYDLDWIRVLCIIILLYYHVGMIYVPWGWHIKSVEKSEVMRWVMIWLHYWRMPLLFFVSGAGTYFALSKRSFGSYARERVKRLFVPLVFGMFVIVPPQIYCERLFNGVHFNGYADFYKTVFNFVPYPEGSFSWHHLWFVAYLFLFSLVSIPLFKWIKSVNGTRFMEKVEKFAERKGGALWYALIITISQVILQPFYPDETHALVDDWAYFAFNILLFWGGYVLVSRPKLWQVMSDQRRLYGWATLITTVIMYVLYYFIRFVYPAWDDALWCDVLWDINSFCLTWFSVLTTVGYGYRYLNRNHPILAKLNEGVYPFYILHQTVIVAIGYYLLKYNLGVWGGFLIISTLSLGLSAGLYWFVIKRVKILRLVFGLK
jgi:glucan biosynthesis protein C